MKWNPKCVICGDVKWDDLATWTYYKRDLPHYAAQEKKRIRILFEDWFPGEKEVDLVYVVCSTCGFVCYSPRPDSDDVNVKYLHLSQWGQEYGRDENVAIYSKRCQRMYSAIKQLLPAVKGKILDYGGGDGRLMAPMKKMGHHCYLVDYNDKPQKYVEKLGDTIEDLDDEHSFDLIICNHVIEHVVDPVGLIRSLSRHLCPAGHLFVEVPMEIWKKPPIQSEPVTHVNFFVKGSLERCFEEAGLLCKVSCITPYLHPSGKIMTAVRAVGIPYGHQASKASSSGRKEVAGYLYPGIIDRMRRAYMLREKLPEMILYKYGLKRSQ